MSRSGRDRYKLDLSVVVPLFNEVGTLDELHRRLSAVLLLLGLDSEIIYVDDGSTDGTREAVADIAERDPRVTVVNLARNYGQTAALAAGFDAAGGGVIVAMDGDLQHEPVRGDAIHLEQVLLNLMMNAMDAMASNTANGPTERILDVTTSRYDKYSAAITVTET